MIGDHIQVLMKESGGTSWYWRNATVASVAADGYNVIFYKASTEQVFFEKSKTRVCEPVAPLWFAGSHMALMG